MKTISENYHSKADMYKVVLIVIFTFFTFFRLYNALTAGLMYDEPETLFNAKQIYLGKLPFVDYFEHHPIVSYLLLAPFSDISMWECQRILMAILGVACSVVLYFFLLSFFDKWTSALCSISFLVSPLLNRMSIMVIPDSFMVFFFVLGLYFYGRILKNNFNSYTDSFLLGFFWSLSILSKIGSIIPIIIFTLFMIFRLEIFKIFRLENGKSKLFYIGYMTLGHMVPIGIIFMIYRFSFDYVYLMINDIFSNVYVRQYISQSLSDRLDVLFNQVLSMYVYLWITAIIGFIYFCKLFLKDISNTWTIKLKEDKYAIILLPSISFFLLIYYNLSITVDSWPQYYMMEEVLLVIMSVGFYNLAKDFLSKTCAYRIYFHRSNRYKISLVAASIILIFFGFVQPLMMSTYPFQPNNHAEERSIVEWLSGENNIDRNKYVFENWIYFNYLVNLKSDYKTPILSDVTFNYLTSVHNRFEDSISLGKNIYENPNYDTIVLHEPMFDLSTWIYAELDRDGWYISKRYNITMTDHDGQVLFWYPGFKVSTYNSYVDIWKRRQISDTVLDKGNVRENIVDRSLDDMSSFPHMPSDQVSNMYEITFVKEENGSIVLDKEEENWKEK